jgi:hypothetical protein
MREYWIVYKGVLLAGQDLLWHFTQVHGHDRHAWIMDDWELGQKPAEKMHQENVWMRSASKMVDYYERNRKLDLWMASPEGQAAINYGREELRRKS